MTVVAGDRAYTKGAPETVLQRCTRIANNGQPPEPFTPAERERLDERLEQLAAQGLRLIACATRDLAPDEPRADRDDLEQQLTLLGLVALSDPVRDAVPGAVHRAHEAGITVHVITGDHGATAAAIARSAGIGAHHHPHVIAGPELDAMSDDELDRTLGTGREVVFAQFARGQAPHRHPAPGARPRGRDDRRRRQ
jgi:magnesium-transporting ATPase (P-type)